MVTIIAARVPIPRDIHRAKLVNTDASEQPLDPSPVLARRKERDAFLRH